MCDSCRLAHIRSVFRRKPRKEYVWSRKRSMQTFCIRVLVRYELLKRKVALFSYKFRGKGEGPKNIFVTQNRMLLILSESPCVWINLNMESFINYVTYSRGREGFVLAWRIVMMETGEVRRTQYNIYKKSIHPTYLPTERLKRTTIQPVKKFRLVLLFVMKMMLRLSLRQLYSKMLTNLNIFML